MSKYNVGVSSTKKYVVTRNGIRVSEQEYDQINDANEEVTHWLNIVNKWPDGSRILVEEYNEKKHKTY
jgi:hypothetical protein